MVSGGEDYEEKRRKRLEENKKRMEELKLHSLSKALKKTPPNPNNNKASSSYAKNKKIMDVAAVRRSTRTAHKPAPNYKENALDPLVGLGGSARIRSSNRRDLSNRVYASDEDRIDAIHKANQLKTHLGTRFPTFVKSMLQSHVTGGFWLSLPLSFCTDYLPTGVEDVTITLVDENDSHWDSKYLVYKNGLSGGWRGFSIDHHLRHGDALLFQLINPTTFKVYIIRANSSQKPKGTNHEEAINNKAGRGKKAKKRNSTGDTDSDV